MAADANERSEMPLVAKPKYFLHRSAVAAADSSTLSTLLSPSAIPPGGGGPVATLRRDIVDCAGWRTVEGFCTFTGGASPSVDLQVLEEVELADGSRLFVPNGVIISGLTEGQLFEAVVSAGRAFMRVDAISGAPTNLSVYLAGGKRQDHDVAQLRR